MTGGEFAVTIDAPVEAVWPWVADLGKHAEWSPKPYAVEWIEGEPNAVGSRFRSVGAIPGDKQHANEGEIAESTRPERFAVTSHDKQGRYSNVITLVPDASGTKVTLRLDFVEMHGVAALLLPVVFPLVGKKDGRARMAMLKQRVEARTTEGPAGPGSSAGPSSTTTPSPPEA
jgi:uncharacterized protein YndB with AHSA1/START domain